MNSILHRVEGAQTSAYQARCPRADLTPIVAWEAVLKRRWPLLIAGALLIAVALVGLSLAIATRDPSRVGTLEGPGEALADQCAHHAPPAEDFRYATQPPASGPHRPRLPRADERRLSDDALLHALELGNVVLTFDGRRPPAALRSLRTEVAGPFDVELAAAGQAVLVVPHPRADGITALAWARRLRTRDPEDPALRDFTEYWLGQGAPRGGNACSSSG